MSVQNRDADCYGRSVGIVNTNDGGDLNRELITNGLAWVYRSYCKAAFCNEWKLGELGGYERQEMPVGG